MFLKFKRKIYQLSKKYGEEIGLDLPYFIKNGFWVSLKIAGMAVWGLVTTITFARLTDPEIYGQYQYFLAIFGLVSILSVPGLNTSLVRAVVQGFDGDYKRVVRISFLWSLLGVLVFLIIGAYYFLYQNRILGITLMASSVFFPLFYAPNTWDWFLQGKSKFDIAACYSLIQTTVSSLFLIITISFAKKNLFLIIMTYLISYSFFNMLFYYKSLKFIENNKQKKETIKYGRFLTKLYFLEIIAANLDKLLIGALISSSQLAVYSVGIVFAKQLQNISKSLLWITVPKIIKQKKLPKEKYLKIFAISSITTLIFFIALKYIIPLFFSEKYKESVFLSQISILFFPFYIIGNIFKNQFLFGKREQILIKESLLSSLSQIILIIFIIPIFGIKGMAVLFGGQPLFTIIILCILEKLSQKRHKFYRR
jgi:O-antigen/teichoic acid export membrane protein